MLAYIHGLVHASILYFRLLWRDPQLVGRLMGLRLAYLTIMLMVVAVIAGFLWVITANTVLWLAYDPNTVGVLVLTFVPISLVVAFWGWRRWISGHRRIRNLWNTIHKLRSRQRQGMDAIHYGD